MIYLRDIILPFLLLLSFAGCTRDEAENVVPGEFRLTLNIAGALPSKSTAPEANESKITNVYLLFYPQSASNTDTPAFFYAETGLNKEGSWSRTFKTTEMQSFEPHINYDVYVLASLPSDVSAPTESTTKETLLALQEQNAFRAISFSGQSTYTTGALGEQKINLKRTVARLDITLDNQMGAQNLSLTMVKEPSSVFYLKDQTENTITDSNRAATDLGGGRFRFYLYEHIAGSHPVWIHLRGTTPAGKPIFHLIEVMPEGSSQIKRNHIYNLTLTLREGDITVSTGTTLDWSEAIAENPTMTEIKPSSNTYLLPPNSRTIGIPVNRPNLANAVNSAIPVINAGEELVAELVWTDVKSSSTNKGLAADASIANIEISGNGPDACLLVTPGSQPGNSVVAVRKKGGDIKWSWHIWVTDYNPETTFRTIGTYTVMDRNLGALNNSSGQPYTIGTYYQWGRFHPFPTKEKEQLAFVPIYNAEGNEVKVNYGGTIVIVSDISNLISVPLSYAKGYDGGKDLWAEIKTVLDPCPVGWHVAPVDFWEKVKYNSTASDGLFVVGTDIFFPTTWAICINESAGGVSILDRDKYTYNWSCNRATNPANYIYYHINKFVGNELGAVKSIDPEWGFPVRCIKETN